ncbi:MAG: hypothetical protein NCW75_14645 [Phycisphaera sp.]|nr:MAG: hypothetical protein NCW75_14645 [Phycisphaera sp.]
MRGSKNNAVLLRAAAGLTIGMMGLAVAPAMADDVIIIGDSLADTYPGVRTLEQESGRVEAFYGVPMTTGVTAEQAAMDFLALHGDEFGVGELTLDVAHQTSVRDGKFTAFLFNQTIDGLPVHLGIGRVLVLDRGVDHAVVYAAGNLAQNAEGDLQDLVFLTPAQATAIVRNDMRFTNFVNFSQPELVAYYGGGQGEEAGQTRPAYRVTAEHVSFPVVDQAFEVFVDAETGEQLLVQSVIAHVDVDGTVSGRATPGLLPDEASNPPTDQRLPLLEVVLRGGADALSDLNGEFTIPHSGTSSVTVDGELVGPWVRVNDVSGPELSASVVTTPPGPADLLFNPSPSQFTTAQVNAFLHTNLSYDFMKSRAPGFTGLDRQTPANVNISDNCNAFFSGGDLSINFFTAGGGCVNTAYSTVVAHEYGHFIVNRLGLSQGAFGEGYGDSVAINLYDTGIVGERFIGGGAVRNPEAARQQFPCGSAIHTCGQVLGGSWRWMRLNMTSTLGSGPALERVQDNFVAWSMITLGGDGSDSATPRTAIEVLTVDDDDGIIGNGTPNYTEICEAFDRHGIDCPELDLLSISVVDAPDTLESGQSGQVRVSITESTAGLVDGSQMLGLIIDGDTQLVSLTADGGDEYVGTIPGQPGLTDVAYFITADADTGDTIRVPSEGGFPVLVGELLVSLDFEAAPGWTVENTAVEDGAWDRGVPLGAGDDRVEDPPTDFDGSGSAFLTDRAADNSDVDGGPTTLISPEFDLSAYDDAIVSYARWFRNDDGDEDRLRIEFSDNGGLTWSLAENVADTPAGWVVAAIRVSDVVDVTDGFRVRFLATDNPNNSVTEAGVDAFSIIVDGGSSCRADFDGDGDLTIFDFLAFQNAFDAGDLAADFDGDGALNIFDFLAFQNEFAAGCP